MFAMFVHKTSDQCGLSIATLMLEVTFIRFAICWFVVLSRCDLLKIVVANQYLVRLSCVVVCDIEMRSIGRFRSTSSCNSISLFIYLGKFLCWLVCLFFVAGATVSQCDGCVGRHSREGSTVCHIPRFLVAQNLKTQEIKNCFPSRLL